MFTARRELQGLRQRQAGAPPALLSLAGFLTAGAAMRAITFGNPILTPDEQFYLLVGSRMLDGALPYVDIWDRKPPGLFALNALFALVGDGVIASQVAALSCGALTALVISRIAGLISTPLGAWLAGLAYLLWLSVVHCFGAQTPVFYNLPMACAAWIIVRLALADQPDMLLRRGSGAMLLAGVAIQIKYAAVFESLAFGIGLVVLAWRARWRAGRLLGSALAWVFCALGPTLLVLAAYAASGHGHAFVQANFVSIFYRQDDPAESLGHLAKTAAAFGPIWLAIAFGWRSARPYAARVWLACWAGAALAGYLLFGGYYDHYAAPLLVPLMILAAPVFARGIAGTLLTSLVLGVGAVAGMVRTLHFTGITGSKAEFAQASGKLRGALGNGCLFVVEGDTALYRATGACMVTPFVFPLHLASPSEARALPVHRTKEVCRAIASRPQAVIVADAPLDEQLRYSPDRACLFQTLQTGYAFAERYRVGRYGYAIYRAGDGVPASRAR